VDHQTRNAWLDKARRSIPDSQGHDSSNLWTQNSNSKSTVPSSTLPESRQISSIPRSPSQSAHSLPQSPSSHLPNSEQQSGTSSSGHWIYPSERQFFDALLRKNLSAHPEDMRTIVPIHNAVNEKAWQEILAWERGRGGDKCGGPRLQTFSGTASRLTPRAWLNTTLWGYAAPFDRHDWVVDRCGTRIEYVIDFYAGKREEEGKPLNFYLDVRPKLNTLEGCKMRFGRLVGL